jgi:hypothetical protein
MTARFCKVSFDVYCDWEGIAPAYRIYLNDELYTERTFAYEEAYLEEMLQVYAEPGTYTMVLEPLQPNLAKFRIEDCRVIYGPARMLDRTQFEILKEETTPAS